MKEKKIVILGVLAVVAVFSLIYGIVTPPASRRARSSPDGRITSERTAPESDAALIPTKRRAARSKYDSWRRSPFVLSGDGTGYSGMALRGIMWNKRNPKAMIGGEIVGRGDKVGSNKVVEIKEDRVILSDGIKDFELKLSQ